MGRAGAGRLRRRPPREFNRSAPCPNPAALTYVGRAITPPWPDTAVRRPFLHGRRRGPADARAHRRIGELDEIASAAARGGQDPASPAITRLILSEAADRRADPGRIPPFVRSVRGAYTFRGLGPCRPRSCFA